MRPALRQILLGGAGGARSLDVAGPELVVNGQFPTDIAGWTDASSAGGSISWNAGRLRTTNSSGTARGRQAVSVEIGQRYSFFAQCFGAVAASVSVGSTTAGSTDLLNFASNGAIAAQAGVKEFTAPTATAQISLSLGSAGVSDRDNITLRKLTLTPFARGTTFTDDFSVKPDGPLGVTPDNLLWREMAPANGTHVYPVISGGKMSISASGDASGITASYPHLDLGDGKVAGIYCDIQWSGAGAVAMISVEPTGTVLTLPNITANSLHMVFTDTKVDFAIYIGGAYITISTVTYAEPVVTDGRTYAGVGWSFRNNTVTATLPDGTTAQCTDPRFAHVRGSVAIPEIFYTGAAVGPVTISKASVVLG